VARLSLRVQPGARRERLVGRMADGTLKVAVTAAPEAGRANAALVRLIARTLRVDVHAVTVARGGASRSKVVEIAGLDDAELRRRIEAALNDGD
jgi:uncharacterized protein (TIGR00251 family)